MDETDDSDERTPWALAVEWTSNVTTIGVEMAVPAAGGYGLDYWLHTLPWFLILGVMLGFGIGMLHLIQLAKSAGSEKSQRPRH